jgi:glycosyltransferase involved in cell wall biosynthesis
VKSLPSLRTPYTYFHHLLDDPFVFVVSAGLLFNSAIHMGLKIASGERCIFVIQPSWNLTIQARDIASRVHKIRVLHEFVQFIVICPTKQDVQLLNSMGVEALHVHKNAFIDEKIFFSFSTISKRFSAVHVANTEKFKRHPLAWGVKNIAVITYSYKNEISLVELGGYRHLGFSNFRISNGAVQLLPPLKPEEVNQIICASKCGLILSAEEGSNNASTEYLLGGIPIITTPSKGGRDEFYDDRHVSLVNPCSDDIETAVQFYLDSSPDPLEIRESVLTKMREHRIRFLNWLCHVSKQNHFLQADGNYWIPQFTNKLRNTVPINKPNP